MKCVLCLRSRFVTPAVVVFKGFTLCKDHAAESGVGRHLDAL
jgi:hypothetical protein